MASCPACSNPAELIESMREIHQPPGRCPLAIWSLSADPPGGGGLRTPLETWGLVLQRLLRYSVVSKGAAEAV